MAWFHDGRRPMLAKGCALRPGATIIKAALVTAVESEVGGQAVAQVRRTSTTPTASAGC